MMTDPHGDLRAQKMSLTGYRNDVPGIRVVVRGKVQGVGYRAYVLDLARSLGLVGEVWNRRDGAVELTAYHSDELILDDLGDFLVAGPGRVDSFDVAILPEQDDKFGFRIGPTR